MGKWSHKYVQNLRGAGTGYGVSERGKGQAWATLVWGPRLLGWPRWSWGISRLATVLAKVAVALNVGPHQVAHLDRVDLPAFAVADLQSQGQLSSCQPQGTLDLDSMTRPTLYPLLDQVPIPRSLCPTLWTAFLRMSLYSSLVMSFFW